MRKFEIIYSYKSALGENIVKKIDNLSYSEVDKYIELINNTYDYNLIGIIGV